MYEKTKSGDIQAQFVFVERTRTANTNAVKRAVAKFLTNNLDENTALAFLTKNEGGITLARALRMTHPKPKDDVQAKVFGNILSHAFNGAHSEYGESRSLRGADKDVLEVFLEARSTDQAREMLRVLSLNLRDVIGGYGASNITAQGWNVMLPLMNQLMVRRNLKFIGKALRETDNVELGDSIESQVIAKLSDVDALRRQKPIPINLLKEAEEILENENVKDGVFAAYCDMVTRYATEGKGIDGNVEIMVDASASMSDYAIYGVGPYHDQVKCIAVAEYMASMIAAGNTDTIDISTFNIGYNGPVSMEQKFGIINIPLHNSKMTTRWVRGTYITPGGGTNTYIALDELSKTDRASELDFIILITDEYFYNKDALPEALHGAESSVREDATLFIFDARKRSEWDYGSWDSVDIERAGTVFIMPTLSEQSIDLIRQISALRKRNPREILKATDIDWTV